jgi:hypothetical protein
MKEYDFYNSNDNDFEIIDECSTNYINSLPENNITNNFTDEKVKLQNFFVNIFKIIFSSRNKKHEFSSKSKKNLDNSSFTVDIEELIEYDNLKAHDSKKKKYIIEFYLYEKDNEDNMIKSLGLKDKPKILVERWKIKYKENFLPLDVDVKNNSFKNYDLFLDKKMKIIEKNIISYSRVLPLFNLLKEDKYSIDFKFNPIKKNKMKFVDENATKTINLISDDMFCFKLSVEYLNIKSDNIDNFFNKIDDDFVIIPSNKSRKRFLSDDYKKSSSQLLKKLEQKDKENLKDNSDEENENNNKYINRRRLSFEDNYYNKKYNPISEEENDSSSEDDLSLVITETNNDTCQTSSDNHKNSENTRKMTDKTDNSNQINNKQKILNKGQAYKEKPKNILAKDKKKGHIKKYKF